MSNSGDNNDDDLPHFDQDAEVDDMIDDMAMMMDQEQNLGLEQMDPDVLREFGAQQQHQQLPFPTATPQRQQQQNDNVRRTENQTQPPPLSQQQPSQPSYGVDSVVVSQFSPGRQFALPSQRQNQSRNQNNNRRIGGGDGRTNNNNNNANDGGMMKMKMMMGNGGGGGDGGGDDDDDYNNEDNDDDGYFGGRQNNNNNINNNNIMDQANPVGATTDVFIWGTDISIDRFKSECEEFFARATDLETGEPVFPILFARILSTIDNTNLQNQTSCHLPVDCRILREFSPDFFRQIVSHPAECFQLMANVAEEIFEHTWRAQINIAIAAFNMPSTIALRELNPENIETLISIKGMVVRTSKLLPEIRVALFRCWKCHASETSTLDRGRIFEPGRCNSCGTPNSFELMHNLCLFDDKQVIRVQEAPENLAEGETPVTVSVVVYGDLVDTAVPGDRVIVTGIFRSAPTTLNPNTRIIRSIFRTHIDALHIEKNQRVGGGVSNTTLANQVKGAHHPAQKQRKSGVNGDGDDDDHDGGGAAADAGNEREAAGGNQSGPPDNNVRLVIDAQTENHLLSLSRLPDIEDILVRSIAPAIFGHDEVKRGILCQLFGGSRKQFRHGTFRSELNVLLCGDPGVAKSQLLTRVHDISPRGVYTSGKGSSSVGLTAFVVRDTDTGEFVLEPGALVLSDRGICCIDEFDKMSDDTRSVLHEVMEQQTLSIAKAGIIAQLNARTSILAAANPKESQWNPGLNIVENLQIEPTLLSRFDLIFLLLDKNDEAQDRRLAHHVLSMYTTILKEDGSGSNAAAAQSQVDRIDGGDNSNGDFDADANDNDNENDTVGNRTTTMMLGNKKHTRNQPPRHPLLDEKGLLSVPNFALYVAYAREVVRPILSVAAEQKIIDSYVEMRQNRGSGKVVTATLRQLESMIRLAESFAKMRFDDEVTPENVEAATMLIRAALQEAATDPRTGLINIGMFSAPDMTKSSLESSALRLEHLIKTRFTDQGKKSSTVHELRQLFNEQLSVGMKMLPQNQFVEILTHISGGGVVLSFTPTMVNFA